MVRLLFQQTHHTRNSSRESPTIHPNHIKRMFSVCNTLIDKFEEDILLPGHSKALREILIVMTSTVVIMSMFCM